MIRLSVVRGVDAGAVLASEADLVRIGRGEANELRLGAQHVSADHASIAFTGDGYVLRDHHSTNGTRVLRGADVLDLAECPGRELVLASGDRIELGERGGAEVIAVEIDEPDTSGIVTVRSVEQLDSVVDQVGSDRDVLRMLYDGQRAISAATDLEDVIDAVAEQVFRLIERATHVTVAVRDEEDAAKGRSSARYVPIGTRERGGRRGGDPVPITRSVFRKVVRDRAAVLAADARREVGETASMLAADIVSTIGVPLWQGEEILGVLQVDNRAKPGMFKERDLDRVALLAQSTSQAVANARLLSRLRVAEERQRSENVYLKAREERRFEGIVGESPAMKSVLAQLKKVADTRVTVLVEGETGTGKEVAASAVHYWSQRRDRLFVAQNCAALPENLLESELFGHKKGAFTGATDDKKGLFELADGGTLFLDEVGEMPLSLQAKLLRALQEGEIRAVGAQRTKKVDVRIVAATNRDLPAEVKAGRFREDLYYRLSVFPLKMPPLRERREDIPLLAGHFLARYAEEFGRAAAGFSQEAMELLTSHDWPGNVRELQNEVQRLVIEIDERAFVEPLHLSPRIRRAENVVDRVRPDKGTLREMMEQVEKWILREALREHDNNKSATAKTLGITREGLHKKLKSFGMG